MPTRGFIVALFALSLLTCWQVGYAEEGPTSPAPTTAAPVVEPPSTVIDSAKANSPVVQKQILYGDFSIKADKLQILGNKDDLNKLSASGNVQIKWPMEGSNKEPLEITFLAASMEIDSQPDKQDPNVISRVATIKSAELTTCANEAGHHHFGLHAKSFTLYPDQHYTARHVSLQIAEHRIFTIPYLRGTLASGQSQESTLPSLTFGQSQYDGTYVGTNYEAALNDDYTATFSARIGTDNNPRGSMNVRRPVALSDNVGRGTLSLVASWHEDVQNRLITTDQFADDRLKDLTITRLPALDLALEPINLVGSKSRQFSLKSGAGIGRYHEDPTDVTKLRSQAWGILCSPKYDIGPLTFSGEFGVRSAFYGNDTHNTYAAQLSLETPENSPFYANVSFLHRREAGTSPFLFDRVLIPDELYTEMEAPLGKKSPLSLNIINRFDLSANRVRKTAITAIYNFDCLSYGITYDTTTKGFNFGMVFNGFGTFHKQAGHVAFTQ